MNAFTSTIYFYKPTFMNLVFFAFKECDGLTSMHKGLMRKSILIVGKKNQVVALFNHFGSRMAGVSSLCVSDKRLFLDWVNLKTCCMFVRLGIQH